MSRLSFPLLFLAFGIAANIVSAQTFTTLYSFSGADGWAPYTGLVQATNGELYGTTVTDAVGTIFKMTPGGTLTTLVNFCQSGCGVVGAYPAALVQATNGDLYGTTALGGTGAYCSVAGGCGTVFKMTPSGAFTTLYSFCAQSGCADGLYPGSALVQAANGDFYGTTIDGGANGGGSIFKITPSGTLSTLYSFCSQSACADGETPYNSLVQASNGDFYGTTSSGGASTGCAASQSGPGCGTVFKITPSGMLTTLYSFCSKSGCTDGADPLSALIQATNGDLYGTTASGGVNCAVGGVIPGCGTIYKITPGGALTTLYSFCSLYECADGETPQQGALVQGEDGDFYGTTPFGLNNGTIFKITPRGKLTTLYSFCSLSECADGEVPFAGLVQATNGIIYGTTYNGGTGTSCSGGCGTVFSLSTGQAPFVETVPTIGVVGERVRILGYKLTGATTVTFNGVPAAFTVDAETEITTKVPAGATTGEVEVVTPDGALSTKVAFEVAP